VFKFSTKPPATAPLEIDDKTYQLPRFLGPQFEMWVEEYKKREIDANTDGMSPRQRAQFLAMFPAVPISVSNVYRALSSPEGVTYVLDWAMSEAGVPKEAREAVHKYGDPMERQELAELLTSNIAIAKAVEDDADEPDQTIGNGADFLPSTSGNTTGTYTSSPVTGTQTTPSSAPPIPEPTRTT
jgi:hypothetical protein